MIPYFFFEEKTPIEYSTKELCDLFLSKQNTHFIYDTHREAQTSTYIRKEISDINKSLEKSNSHFTIILGGEPTNEWGKKSMFIYNMINLNRTIVDNHSNESLENYTNVSCIYNNNYFARSLVLRYSKGGKYFDLYNTKFKNLRTEFDTFLVYLNRRINISRCKMMDAIQKTNLLENSIWSWLMHKSSSESYDFKNWKEELVCVEGEDIGIDNFRDININHIKNGFIELISETFIDKFFLTEKTIKPLIFGNLFIIHGCINFHKKLENLGFKLYDEVIDYSFDSLESEDDRINGIISNLQNLKNKNHLEIYNTLEEKIKFNQEHCKKLAWEYSYNKDLLKLIDTYKGKFINFGDNEEMFCNILAKQYFSNETTEEK